MGHPGAVLGPAGDHLGTILGPSWAFLGPSWGHLGPSWDPGTPQGPPRTPQGPPKDPQGPPRTPQGPPRGTPGTSQRPPRDPTRIPQDTPRPPMLRPQSPRPKPQAGPAECAERLNNPAASWRRVKPIMRSLFRDLNAREAAAGDPGALRLYGLRSGAGSLFWGDLRARGRPVPPKALQSGRPLGRACGIIINDPLPGS